MDASFLHRWQIMKGDPGAGDAAIRSATGLALPGLILLDRLDLVPEPSRGLVVLGGDGTLELVAELDQGRLLLGVPWRPLGHLAGMAGVAVDALEQRHQF